MTPIRKVNQGKTERGRKKKNYHVINYQIHDTLAELHNQGKKIILCKVPADIGTIENEEADKAGKQVIDMPGMTTKRLPLTD